MSVWHALIAGHGFAWPAMVRAIRSVGPQRAAPCGKHIAGSISSDSRHPHPRHRPHPQLVMTRMEDVLLGSALVGLPAMCPHGSTPWTVSTPRTDIVPTLRITQARRPDPCRHQCWGADAVVALAVGAPNCRTPGSRSPYSGRSHSPRCRSACRSHTRGRGRSETREQGPYGPKLCSQKLSSCPDGPCGRGNAYFLGPDVL